MTEPADLSQQARELVALRSRAGVALIAATILASLIGFLDANVVNVAVPAIGRDLGASVETLQWSLTGYLLTVAALLLVSGALSDHFGRKRLLVSGLVVMLLASILCASAPTIGALIAGRIIQGIGGALVVPNSLALLNATLRKPDRARGIGIWAGLATLGTTCGPYAGGWLVDHASWRSVFLLNLPLILMALLALARVPEINETRRPLSVDIAGGLLAVLGLGGVIYALNAGSTFGWLSARVVISGVVGLISLAALLPVERRMRAPMIRLSLFASRQFDAINLTTVLLYGGLAAAGYLLVLQCELQLGYSASKAGAVLIPSSTVFLALSPVSGALVSRFGPRWLMASGITSVAAGFLWLSTARAGSGYATAILPGVLLWGLGIGLTVTPLTAAVLATVNDADLGEASAVSDAASRLGALIAIALVPALIGVSDRSSLGLALKHGYQPAMISLAGLAFAAAIISALFVTNDRSTALRIAPPMPHHGYHAVFARLVADTERLRVRHHDDPYPAAPAAAEPARSEPGGP